MYKTLFRLVVFGILLQLLLFSCKKTSQTSPTITEQSFLLGTPLLIQIFQGGSKGVIDDIFYEVEQIERTMSTSAQDYSSTEIMDMNEQSKNLYSDMMGSYRVSQDVAVVLKKAIEIAELTDGAFDPSIQPLVALWGFDSDAVPHIPLQKTIEKTLLLVKWRTLSIDMQSRMFMMKGQQGIDVGGIAKGYAANMARQKLKEAGVTSAIIDFGGNIITVGDKIDNTPWKIGIQEPFGELGTPVITIDTGPTSVVTSGVYERNFTENDKLYSHLINPKTGYPVKNNLWSVSIITEDSMYADGLSTGVFVLGVEKGIELVESQEGVEAIFITSEKKVYVTSGVKDLNFEIRNQEYKLVDSIF